MQVFRVQPGAENVVVVAVRRRRRRRRGRCGTARGQGDGIVDRSEVIVGLRQWSSVLDGDVHVVRGHFVEESESGAKHLQRIVGMNEGNVVRTVGFAQFAEHDLDLIFQAVKRGDVSSRRGFVLDNVNVLFGDHQQAFDVLKPQGVISFGRNVAWHERGRGARGCFNRRC